MKRLAIVVSHPIQHFSPWFRALSEVPQLCVKIFYGDRHGAEPGLDIEFGQRFAWDIPLLDGYEYEFVENGRRSLSTNAGFFSVSMKGVRESLMAFQPHVIMVLGWQLFFYWRAVYAAKRMRIPYLVRGESNLLRRGALIRWMVKQLTVGRICRGSACCLAIGIKNQALYKAYGVPQSRIRLAPYFVDNQRFANAVGRLNGKRNEIRGRYGIPPDSTVFLFVGKLIPKKRPHDLLDAYLSLPRETRIRSSLLFVGDGALAQTLKSGVDGQESIKFTGFLNQARMPEAYATANVLVLPSDARETWGLAVNEAMASGLPAIVSDRVGCADDLVLDGKTGFVFQYGDVKGISALMEQLIRNPDTISKLGKDAHFHVQNYSIQRAVQEVVKAVEEFV